MNLLINKKCLTKIEKLKQELKGIRKDLVKNDIKGDIRLLKLTLQEAELRKQIEKEKLLRKFHEPQQSTTVKETSELDKFINSIKAHSNKKEISKAVQKQEVSYLIKGESGVYDKSLSELVKLVTPNEKDMKDALEELGLKHMIKKK